MEAFIGMAVAVGMLLLALFGKSPAQRRHERKCLEQAWRDYPEHKPEGK